MNIDKLAILFLCIIIFFLSYIAKIRTKTWINPSSVLNNFWLIYILVPIIVAYKEPISFYAVLYITIFNSFFTISIFLFNWKILKNIHNNKLMFLHVFSKSYILIFISFFSSLLIIMSSIKSTNMSLSYMILNPIEFASFYAGLNYSGSIKPSFLFRLGLMLNYFVPIIGGIVLNHKPKFLYIILSFLPSLLILLFQSQKGMIFFSIFLLLGSFLFTKYIFKYKLNPKLKYNLFVFLLMFISLVLFSFISRGMSLNSGYDAITSRLYEFALSYSSGHIYAFSYWFTNIYNEFDVNNIYNEMRGIGFYTFMFIYDILGFADDIPTGVYDDYYKGIMVKTNIYTIHRGILSDFGMIGAFIFALIIGFIFNFIFYRINIGKGNCIHFVVYCFMFGIFYQSFIISSFLWLFTPLVIILCCLSFYLINEFVIYEKK